MNSLIRTALWVICLFYISIPASSLCADDLAPLNAKTSTDSAKIIRREIASLSAMQEAYPQLASIPTGFYGESFSYLHKSIVSAIGYKTKYESSDDYKNKKQKAIKDHPLLFNGYILLHDSGLFKLDYDADHKRLSFQYPSVLLDTKTQDLGAYTGSNAFGVSKQIKKVSKNVYEIELKNKYAQKTAFAAMAPETAKRHDGLLDLIYIIQLTPPYIQGSPFGESQYHEPTLRDPEERSEYTYTMDALLRGLIIYDRETGEIVYQEKLF